MKPTRTLRLRREALSELSPDELARVVGAEDQTTTDPLACVIIVTILAGCLPTRTCFCTFTNTCFCS